MGAIITRGKVLRWKLFNRLLISIVVENSILTQIVANIFILLKNKIIIVNIHVLVENVIKVILL